MEERIVIAGGDGIREAGMPQGNVLREIRIEGAGALCALGTELFVCGGRGDVIWRIERERLVPTGLCAGGPGVCRLMASRDGKQLYALCADADSLLMLSAASGAALMVSRAGVCPRAMAMDASGERIAVAGGKCGEVLLMNAHTLDVTQRLRVPGVALDVAMGAGGLYALSHDEGMNACLTSILPSGKRHQLALSGMAGAILPLHERIAVATQGWLHLVSAQGHLLRRIHAPGCASRLFAFGGTLLLLDVFSDTLYAYQGGRWRPFLRDALDVCADDV